MAPSRGFIPRLYPSLRFICPKCQTHSRNFTTTLPLHSGHNRWSKIKHDKAKADSIKNNRRSHYAQEIATASKLHGPDPTSNPRLGDLITKAKKEGFAKSSIEAAIARGQGRSALGEKLESVVVEGILPGNVGVVVECETDNKARTLTGVRGCLKEKGGSATPCAYLFGRKGRVVLEGREGVGLESVLDAALDAGAEDIVELEDDEGGGFAVFADPENTTAVAETLSRALGMEIRTSEIVWCANEDTKVGLSSDEAAEELSSFVDEVQDKEPSVQAVAMNVAQGKLGPDTWRELQHRLSV